MANYLSHRKFVLNRATATKDITEYLENSLIRDDESLKHCFHKILVQNWMEDDTQLFNTMSDYFHTIFIPVDYMSKTEISSFYTCSLSLIMKIIRLDFLFSYRGIMFNVDILFNNTTSAEFFERRTTIDEIVSSVVSNRFNEKMELDLSNFCNDTEFVRTKINFYKLNLLANFKALMLRMGRDTRILNLSNNGLIQVPLDILNFFIKGELIGINLSSNNIPSIQEPFRVTSKIEKLWLEGNPLCEQLEADEYIKKVLVKFPRLIELDGVQINQFGILYPFYKHFILTPDNKTRMVIEKFLTLYFAHYDTTPRTKVDLFYDANAVLTISSDFSNYEDLVLPHYALHSRNAVNSKKKIENKQCVFKSRESIVALLCQFPPSTHDLNSFSVDVLQHDNNNMILVLDGVFKERSIIFGEIYKEYRVSEGMFKEMSLPENYFKFRRTFIFSIHTDANSLYHITNEMFSISLAEWEQKENSFKFPIKNMNELCLLNPDKSESQTICKIFMHLTMLKKLEAERRLKSHSWDIRVALKQFIKDIQSKSIPNEYWMEDENNYYNVSSEID